MAVVVVAAAGAAVVANGTRLFGSGARPGGTGVPATCLTVAVIVLSGCARVGARQAYAIGIPRSLGGVGPERASSAPAE